MGIEPSAHSARAYAHAMRPQPYSAKTVAAICQDRWQMERLFNALQQWFELKIMTFVGPSANPVKTPISTTQTRLPLHHAPGSLRFV